MEVKKVVIAYLLLTVLCVPIFGVELSNLPIQAEESDPPKKIALTFDDGPSEKSTGAILDLLSAYKIRATFFVVGVNVCKNPELLRREVAEGHEIGNHTFTHPHLKRLGQTALEAELQQTADAVYAISGKEISIFRPPEGYRSDFVKSASESMGYSQVFWSIDTKDWSHSSAESIVKTVEKNVRDGSIVLMHDSIIGEAHTLEALKQIIPDLIGEGYIFVTVSELG